MLRLAPSHTHFYRKLDQFGKVHDAIIKEKLQGECDRLQGLMGEPVKEKQVTEQRINDESTKKEATVSVPKVSDHQSIAERIAKSFAALDDSKEANETTLPKVLLFQRKSGFSQPQPTVSTCSTASPAAVSSVIPTKVSVAEKHDEVKTTSNSRPNTVPDAGRKIVLDNIDYHQHTHDMTVDNKDADLHYCSYMATENRVSGNHLSSSEPILDDLMGLENGVFCPNKIEHQKQRSNYIDLVSRYITEEIPCLEFLKTSVSWHIEHQYSEEMKQRTDTVSLTFL